MHEEDEEIEAEAINEVLIDNSENQSEETKSEESTNEE